MVQMFGWLSAAARFPLEAFQHFERGGLPVRQNLEGHHPCKTSVRGLIHLAHAAGTRGPTIS
jgi:hypothetical protein